MAITGGIKIFEKSKSLLELGTTIAATTGTDSAIYAIDRNAVTYWRSAGSNDATTETITVNFSSIQTFNRIFLADINFKAFDIMYDSGGTWVNFANVIGIDGAKADTTETVFNYNTAYYEFTQVSTLKIRIRVTTTQVANDEKFLSQIIVTNELGTFKGYPEIDALDLDRNARAVKTLSGRFSVQKGDETIGFRFKFKSYPVSSEYNPDFDLVMSLQDSEDPFLVWLCGGRTGVKYFRYAIRGFRLKDIYQMQITKPLQLEYVNNVYINPINANVTLEESI